MAPLQIIVVEDDPFILMTAAHALRSTGFQVLEADTADRGLDLLERNVGDIAALFSDIETPGTLDGLDLAKTVAERWPLISVVLTSGRVSPAVSALPPSVSFLGKPYDLDAVAQLIRNLSSN